MGKVIGITGCTRSGKSWVAKELASALRARGLRATVVSQDSFWRRAVQISLRTPSVSGASKETQAWSEEEPACVDHAAFASQIRSKRDECDVVIAEGFLLAHAAEVVAALGAIFLLVMVVQAIALAIGWDPPKTLACFALVTSGRRGVAPRRQKRPVFP